MHPRPVHLYALDPCLLAGWRPAVQQTLAVLQSSEGFLQISPSRRKGHPCSGSLTHFCLPAVQGMLFIIFGVSALLVQTLLLRVMLSCLSEARVLVLGEPSPLPTACQSAEAAGRVLVRYLA